jgi:hypothetical protein
MQTMKVIKWFHARFSYHLKVTVDIFVDAVGQGLDHLILLPLLIRLLMLSDSSLAGPLGVD